MTEGFLIGGGLFIVGMMLQLMIGPVDWSLFAWPVNLIAFFLLLILIGGMYAFRKKAYVFGWMMHMHAAVPALCWALVLTVIMGFVPQTEAKDGPWLSRMLSFWPFVLSYAWVCLIAGLTALDHMMRFSVREIPFTLNHLGVFLAVVSATLGHADMQDLQMTVQTGKTQWIAQDGDGNQVEMKLAIELHEFTIDEYPPKLVITDVQTNRSLPVGHPASLVLEEGVSSGHLLGWDIRILQQIPQSAAVSSEHGIRYEHWNSVGSTFAAEVEARKDGKTVSGWVSCGSFAFPSQPLPLEDGTNLVMPARMPKRYASDISVYTENGQALRGIVEVNKPLKVEGWKIYQYSYDERLSKWSDVSVFSLVRDPWLWLVYLGIFMMIAGAVCLFLFMAPKPQTKEDKK